MERCKTCKWWQLGEGRYDSLMFPLDPATYRRPESEDEVKAKYGFLVRNCEHPKVVFYERPQHDGATVCDGSEYDAHLLTAEDFGCVLHEPSEQPQTEPEEQHMETLGRLSEGVAIPCEMEDGIITIPSITLEPIEEPEPPEQEQAAPSDSR